MKTTRELTADHNNTVKWYGPLGAYFVSVGFLFYVVGAFAVDLREVVQTAMRLDAGMWFIVLALSLANYGLRFGRWHAYLQGLGHKIPWGHHFTIYMAGFALTLTPGKIGEGIRALYLKRFGVGLGRCLSALYAERLLDVMAVSLLAALLFMAPAAGFRWLAFVGGALAVILLAAQHPAVLAVTRRLVDLVLTGWLRTLGERITAFQRDVTSLLRARLLAFGLVLGLAAWGAEGVGLYLVAQALDIDIGFWTAIGIYAVAVLAGALSFLPGGLGSAEAVMVALLALSGASLPAAVATTGLVRLATLWFAVALGAVAWLVIEMLGRDPSLQQPRLKGI